MEELRFCLFILTVFQLPLIALAAGYNETCGIDSDCEPPVLKCVGSKCTCPGENIGGVKWQAASQMCFMDAGKPCVVDPSTEDTLCIATASCKNIDGTPVCVCNYGLTPNTENKCHLFEGDKCNTNWDLCNPLDFLHCGLLNKCECNQTGSIFNPTKRMCVLLPGAECQIDKSIKCIEGTTCQKDETEIFKCLCNVNNTKPTPEDKTKCFLNHGDLCATKFVTCNPYKFLECNSGVCSCLGEGITSRFDNRTMQCQKLATETCHLQEMPCIHSATCKKLNTESVCVCSHNLQPNRDKMCQHSYGQACQVHNDMCDPNQFLSCNLEHKCSCYSDSIYDLEAKTCQLLPNSVCNNSPESQKCVSTTQCRYSTEFETEVCRCPGASHPSKIVSTLCVLNHNEPCAEDRKTDLCDPYSFLKCSNLGHCGCRDEWDKTHFDKDAEMCYLKAGQACSMIGSLSQSCTPNSICVNHNGMPSCVCKRDLFPNRKGQCFLPHLSHCSLSRDLCDAASFLKCDFQNTCTCEVDTEYNKVKETCHLLANASCVPSKLLPVGAQPCLPNAICSEKTKRCECIDDLTSNNDRHCTLQHGAACDPVVDLCDTASFLECDVKSRTCMCEGEKEHVAVFSKFQRKCYRLAGEKCGDDIAKCIYNSHCDPIERICVCNESMKLQPNKKGLCFLQFESSCDTKNNLCDPSAFLECTKDDFYNSTTCKCQREYETFYDENDKTCRLINDRPCLLNSELSFERIQLCDSNAICEASAPGNKTYRCHCKPGFIPNKEKVCFFPYEADCSTQRTECDKYGFLVCQPGKKFPHQCLCSSGKMYFNTELQQCLTFPGELCDAKPTSQKCRENAYCGRHSVCECLPGFQPTYDDHCLLQYRAACSQEATTEDLCDDRVNLKCRAGFCLCREGFLEHKIKMLKDAQKTVCLPGYNMTCQDLHNPELENLLCNPGAFLACNKGVCRCNNELEQMFVVSESQCRQTLGMPCNNKNERCIPNAECLINGFDERGNCICDENSTVSWGDSRLCVENSAPTNVDYYFMLSVVFLVTKC